MALPCNPFLLSWSVACWLLAASAAWNLGSRGRTVTDFASGCRFGTAILRRKADADSIFIFDGHLAPMKLYPLLDQVQETPGSCSKAEIPSGLSEVYDNPAAG